ncbi:L-lactate dehydrogenase [Patescibacteria group bacterium]
MHKSHIAIIGTGAVGASTAFALTTRNLGSHLTLIDVSKERQEGEVMDLSHGLTFVETNNICTGTFRDAAKADIIIHTAGAAQKPGETRLDLVRKNVEITRSIFKSVGKIRKDAIILVVSNPVDILTYVTQEISGLPQSQVFGSGTLLDTSRLKWSLGQQFHINPSNIHAYMLGEHGDSEFAAYSLANIAGVPLRHFPEYDPKVLKKIEDQTKRAAYEIIKRKGATYYAIALAVTEFVEAIMFNQNAILPTSVRLNRYRPSGDVTINDVCLGVPAVIGAKGVNKIIRLHLSAAEGKKLKKSADVIKKHIRSAFRKS